LEYQLQPQLELFEYSLASLISLTMYDKWCPDHRTSIKQQQLRTLLEILGSATRAATDGLEGNDTAGTSDLDV
jgi:hypothetical protein